MEPMGTACGNDVLGTWEQSLHCAAQLPEQQLPGLYLAAVFAADTSPIASGVWTGISMVRLSSPYSSDVVLPALISYT